MVDRVGGLLVAAVLVAACGDGAASSSRVRRADVADDARGSTGASGSAANNTDTASDVPSDAEASAPELSRRLRRLRTAGALGDDAPQLPPPLAHPFAVLELPAPTVGGSTGAE